MRKVIRIISRIDGAATPFDLQFVKKYDPTVHGPDGNYNGGVLETTPDIAEALKFNDAAEAFKKWCQSTGCACHGVRPHDGKLNRPLTAFHCLVENAS